MSYLYLGDSRHAAQKSVLKDLGVTAIVNVSKTLVNHFPEDFVYKTIPVDDKTDTELAPWFNETISFIGKLFALLLGVSLVKIYNYSRGLFKYENRNSTWPVYYANGHVSLTSLTRASLDILHWTIDLWKHIQGLA